MFRVNNKDTRTTLLESKSRNFEHAIAGWDSNILNFFASTEELSLRNFLFTNF